MIRSFRRLARLRSSLPRTFCNIPKLRIVFGSQTGTAEAFANDLEFDACDNDIDAEVIDAMDLTVDDLTKSSDSITAFVMASYGEGIPTDNAVKFCSQLSANNTDLCMVKYAVFGLGNSQCFQDRYNVVAKRLDERLQQLGGTRLMDIGLGDASGNNFQQFADWKEKLIEGIKDGSLNVEPSASRGQTVVISDESPTSSPPSPPLEEVSTSNCVRREGVDVPLELSSRQLAMVPSGRQVLISRVERVEQRFKKTDEVSSAVSLTFDISQSRSLSPRRDNELPRLEGGEAFTEGLRAGDHIGVFAPNSSVLIARFAANAGLTATELERTVEGISSSPSTTLRQMLMWQLQLSGVVPLTTLKVLHKWAKENDMTVTAQHLRELVENYEERVRANSVDICGVLARIPRSPYFPPLPLTQILKTLPPISPRLYSMVSNPPQHRLTASLLCRLLRYRDSRSTIVSGLCSSYLCERLQPNDEAAIFFREAAFHLPEDASLPVVMICGGTGIAPFASFLEERARRSAAGESLGVALLYYGCRNPHEYMFREELCHYLSSAGRHVLDSVVVCFSDPIDTDDVQSLRESACEGEEIAAESMMITDMVDRQTEQRLVPLMQKDAHIYVCGGAGNFGKAVRTNVENMVRKAYSVEELGGEEATRDPSLHYGVRYVVANKRYFEDLAD